MLISNAYDGTDILTGTSHTNVLPPHVCAHCGATDELLVRGPMAPGPTHLVDVPLLCWGRHGSTLVGGKVTAAVPAIPVRRRDAGGHPVVYWPTLSVPIKAKVRMTPAEMVLHAWRLSHGEDEPTFRTERLRMVARLLAHVSRDMRLAYRDTWHLPVGDLAYVQSRVCDVADLLSVPVGWPADLSSDKKESTP